MNAARKSEGLEEYQLSFGRYKGKPLSQVPTDYLQCVVENVSNKPRVVSVVKKLLQLAEPKVTTIARMRGRGIMVGLKRPPAPSLPKIAVPAKIDIVEECTNLVRDVYERTRPIDILTLSEGNRSKYEHWMDVTRMMQSVLDRDGGKALPPIPMRPARVLKGDLVGRVANLS